MEKLICPIKMLGRRDMSNFVNGPFCDEEKCAWYCPFAKECAVPLLAGILADSTINQIPWGKGGAE